MSSCVVSLPLPNGRRSHLSLMSRRAQSCTSTSIRQTLRIARECRES